MLKHINDLKISIFAWNHFAHPQINYFLKHISYIYYLSSLLKVILGWQSECFGKGLIILYIHMFGMHIFRKILLNISYYIIKICDKTFFDWYYRLKGISSLNDQINQMSILTGKLYREPLWHLQGKVQIYIYLCILFYWCPPETSVEGGKMIPLNRNMLYSKTLWFGFGSLTNIVQ